MIIVTVTKGYSLYGSIALNKEKNGNIRLVAKFGYKDKGKGLLKLIVRVVNHVIISYLRLVDYRGSKSVL
jgi:hypothetical protein